MGHQHHQVSGMRLGITVVLNVVITLAELVGGILSGSMALITDAAHNFSDVLSLLISYIANRIARRKATLRQTYGFGRSEILAAFANSVTLIVIALIIVYEAVERLINPVTIASDWVIWLAGGSIVLNGLSVLLIKGDAAHNMNMRSALLHLFSDMLTSIAVLAGGLIMKWWGWYQVDAIFSLVIAAYLLYMSWGIFRESLGILMQFSPRHIDIRQICDRIAALPGIVNIHHIHCWQLDDRKYIFDGHIDLEDDICISEFEDLLARIEKILAEYGIGHVNIQPEIKASHSKNLIKDHAEHTG